MNIFVYKGGEWTLPLRNRSFARFNSFSRLGTAEIFAIFQIRPVFVWVNVCCHARVNSWSRLEAGPIRLYFSIFLFQITIASFFV